MITTGSEPAALGIDKLAVMKMARGPRRFAKAMKGAVHKMRPPKPEHHKSAFPQQREAHHSMSVHDAYAAGEVS